MWRLKVLVQFILAHIPFGEAINHQLQRVQTRRRGGNATELRERIADVAPGVEHLAGMVPLRGATVVEVGTGWDALPTMMLAAMGTSRIYTYDHVPHLRADLVTAAVRALLSADPVRGNGRLREIVQKGATLGDVLSRASIRYVAPGDATCTRLRERSVDLFYSFAVLEHVPDDVAERMIAEAKRVLRPGGVFYALIGLGDHYHGFDAAVSEVNFLQYPEWLWAFFVKNNISYHNRLRERDFLEMLTQAGAEIVKINHRCRSDDVERVRAMRVDRRFSRYTPEELAISRTEIFAVWR